MTANVLIIKMMATCYLNHATQECISKQHLVATYMEPTRLWELISGSRHVVVQVKRQKHNPWNSDGAVCQCFCYSRLSCLYLQAIWWPRSSVLTRSYLYLHFPTWALSCGKSLLDKSPDCRASDTSFVQKIWQPTMVTCPGHCKTHVVRGVSKTRK